MEGQKPINRWVRLAEIVGGFGGLLGGIGAFIAIFLLMGNLNELKRQTEFQHRGFLAISILGAKGDTLQPKGMSFDYKLIQVSRVPITLSGGEAIGMTSKPSAIDFVAWGKAEEQNIQGFDEYRIPILEDTITTAVFSLSSKHMLPDSVVSDGKDSIGYYGFYLHLLYKYMDVTSKEYWGYMRWRLDLNSKDFDDKKLKKFDGNIRPEYWRTWEAKGDKITNSNLPRDLRDIRKKALNQSKSKVK